VDKKMIPRWRSRISRRKKERLGDTTGFGNVRSGRIRVVQLD